MHMGNARGGVLGDCLSSVLDWSGNDVTREFYINDAGNQVDKFAHSVEGAISRRSAARTPSSLTLPGIRAMTLRHWRMIW